MIKRFIKNMMREIGILLVFAAIAMTVIALRFALYAPGLLDHIFRAIGG